MPVTAADLTYPIGEIRPEWFEGDTQPVVVAEAAAAGAVSLSVAPLLGGVPSGVVLEFGGVAVVTVGMAEAGAVVLSIGALAEPLAVGARADAPLRLADALGAWIAQGYAQVPAGATEAAGDAVARASANFRAYDAKAAAMAANPDSVNLDGLGVTTSVGRVKFFAGKADEWRGALVAALAAAAPPPVAEEAPRSRSYAAEFSWY